MTLQRIALVALVLIALAAAWRYREPLSALASPADRRAPPPIVFDNGTVRNYAPASAASGAAQAVDSPPGVMRKCVAPKSTVYTDRPCPPGSREQALGGGSVTVVPGQQPAATAAVPALPAPKTVREALVGENPHELRDKVMERAISR